MNKGDARHVCVCVYVLVCINTYMLLRVLLD